MVKIDIRDEPIQVVVDILDDDKKFHINSYPKNILYFNNGDDLDNIRCIVKRLREILRNNKKFRCEDLDIISWNTSNFRYVSGSTYIKDGKNYKMFHDAITELETKVIEYSV